MDLAKAQQKKICVCTQRIDIPVGKVINFDHDNNDDKRKISLFSFFIIILKL